MDNTEKANRWKEIMNTENLKELRLSHNLIDKDIALKGSDIKSLTEERDS